MSGMLLC